MKLNGKEVIEIRPMTRYEYGIKNNEWSEMGGCVYCIGLHKIKYCNPKTVCSKQPAYVNGKFKMIVRVKRTQRTEKWRSFNSHNGSA